MHNTKENITGSSLILLSAIAYGFFGVWTRLLESSFDAFSQHGARSLIALSFYSLLFLFRITKWKKIAKEDIRRFIIWAFSGAGVMVILFVVMNNLPLGTAYFLFYSTTLISCILSGKFLFDEKLSPVKWMSIALVAIGFFVIFTIDIDQDEIVYVSLALLAGVLTGFWSTYSKRVSSKYSNPQMLLVDAIAGVIIAMSGFLVSGEKFADINLEEGWMLVLGYALTHLFASNAVVFGFRYVEAQIGGLIMPLEVIFAAVFGYWCFDEVLSISVWIGGALILLASILPNIMNLIENQKQKSICNRVAKNAAVKI
ncbi:MAG: DMT family transporter [Alphaproteobacteria bacterium]|nr:DMT family transporter [Alphaproteobacteria bacterium]